MNSKDPLLLPTEQENDDSASGGSLDCTLLESLFYNEMIKMDHQLLFPPSLEEIAAGNNTANNPVVMRAAEVSIMTMTDGGGATSFPDPLTTAEQSFLSDFGFLDQQPQPTAMNANNYSAPALTATENLFAPPVIATDPGASVFTPVNHPLPEMATARTMTTGVNASQTANHQGSNTQSLITQRLVAGNGTTALYSIQTLPPQQHELFQPQQRPAEQLLQQNPAAAPLMADDDKQRTKLLAQFTTLASRLGIELPTQALQSLASKSSTSATIPMTATTTKMNHASSEHRMQEAPATMFANDTAKESSPSTTPVEAATTTTTDAASSSTSSLKPRRKKPRLSECDAKLAQLQEENALLQSRLQALQQQSRQSNHDRQLHEQKLSTLLQQENASPQEIQTLIDHYQELYSDYGRRRHLELQWHLEQLERLANPTNVTKMGLYTLGQGPLQTTANTIISASGDNADEAAASRLTKSSSTATATTNPIVGLLQKELGITSQQSKKILEQRQKIRIVCANLRQCLALLGKLKELCEQKTRIFHDRLSKCREILTPEQVLKLLVWIHQHNETVAQVCPGWGSEHLAVSKTT